MCLNKISNNIFVINLKKRIDRLKHIQNELSKINCTSYEVIDAVDGREINRPSMINNGALGLVLTYFKIFEQIKNNPPEEIILIEDDCVFSENFCENVNHFLNELPNDWNILYFGGNHNLSLAPPPSKLTEHVCKVHHTYSTHCVVMKTKVFFELIEILKTLRYQTDVGLSFLQKKYPSYTTSKKITWQVPSYSDIENKLVNYNSTLKDE